MLGRHSLRRSLPLLALLGVNLFPLVGVFVYDWTLASLLVLYWLEMGIGGLWAVPKALLAERQTTRISNWRLPLSELREKRGGKRLWTGGPPLYVRNVPLAVSLLGVLLFVWLGFGLLFAAEFRVLSAMTPGAVRTVAVGAVGMAVGRGVEFWRDFLGREEYADVSAGMILATPARHAMGVILLSLVAGAVADPWTAGAAVLVLVVVARLVSEVYGYWAEHYGEGGGRLTAVFGARDTSEPPPAVTVPEGDPDDTVRPDTPAVLVNGLLPALSGLASRPGYLAVLLLVFGALWLGPVVAAVGVAAVTLVVAAKLGSHYLLYGTVEYRRYGDELVCYDRFLGEAQFRVGRGRVVESSVPKQLTARLLGTGAISLDWRDDGDDRRDVLGPFADVDDAARRLGLAARSGGGREPNRAVAVAASAIALSFLAIPVGLLVASDISGGGVVLLLLFLGPLVAVTLGPVVWVAAMNW